MDHSAHWATRLMHEHQCHETSSFLTLTYSNEHYPDNGSVSKREIQTFMKRLRFSLSHPVRFFACGEYGSKNWRAHYHMILFGYDFPDKTPWRRSASGHITCRSAELEKLWPLGNCEVGTVTRESAGYVARYSLKKIGGDAAASHYARPHPVTGEIVQLDKEFILMSNRPGIGFGWFQQYGQDWFPGDFVTHNGEKLPVPRYYVKKLDEAQQLRTTLARQAKGKLHAADQTPERLGTREEVQLRRAERLIRSMERNDE